MDRSIATAWRLVRLPFELTAACMGLFICWRYPALIATVLGFSLAAVAVVEIGRLIERLLRGGANAEQD